MGNVFFTSDTHFGHENIIKFCDRPFNNTHQMDNYIMRMWNSVVSKNDTVYMLGDFSFHNNVESSTICRKLNGTKYLIRGNHDERSNHTYRKMGFEDVYDHPIVLNEFFVLSHEPLPFIVGGPMVNIFGHVHNSSIYPTYTPHSACVCTERHFYKPVEMNGLVASMKGAQRC